MQQKVMLKSTTLVYCGLPNIHRQLFIFDHQSHKPKKELLNLILTTTFEQISHTEATI